MKILLIHPFYEYSKTKEDLPFPFDIGYIAGYLIHKGHEAEILDLNATYLRKSDVF